LSASPSMGDGCAGQHTFRPRFAGELVGLLPCLSCALGRYADRRAVEPVAGFRAYGRENAPGDRLGQAATIRGSTEADYQTGGVKQRISCPIDYLELPRRSAQHLMRVFAEKQRVVFN
jgi:hypothetical protein